MAKASELYVDIAAGQYLFREGDAGAEMYIVESGSIAILRSARGSEPLAVLEPGDFLGEMAVLEDQPRFASALARTDCRLLRIERAAFAELLRQNVEIAVRIMRKLALRQRRAEQRVSELQQELQQLRAASAPAAASAEPAPRPASPPPVAAPAAPAAAASQPVAPPAVAAPPAIAPVPVAAAPVATAPAPVAPAAPPPAASPLPAAAVSPPPAAASGGPALLHAASGQRFPLESGREEFLIGRVDPVTGITPEINLGALDTARSLSRRHAKLLRQGVLLFLREEVGTANGTFVNGRRIATGEPVPVKPGDRLRFGTIDIELVAS
ncbi:MAG: hypothetical protein BGP24_12175 [Lysobacterales bacterium 69-70]|nr:cyclic nucleotide-binding domain-containing protein [Xanthomonadaceae bacterium]ODU30960.1 MAG: hypothetical protein ABS97_21935 [Xanthomonadaceae bacterium SCN 69-320]ODV15494.1 MAG: hypothetical protein ABT27_22760 [Xanthomonadaceae bacterium SCN 69-25]OJY98548.1 MAG: hypothetical protein BGP24_12175 [Xanthomonadales bacterium 69-70]